MTWTTCAKVSSWTERMLRWDEQNLTPGGLVIHIPIANEGVEEQFPNMEGLESHRLWLVMLNVFYTWSFGGNHLTKARWFESFLRAPYPDPDLENSWSCTFQHCCNYIWSWYRLDSVRLTTFVGTKSVVNYRYIGPFISTQAIQVPITGWCWLEPWNFEWLSIGNAQGITRSPRSFFFLRTKWGELIHPKCWWNEVRGFFFDHWSMIFL